MPKLLEFVINHWDLFLALAIILLMMFSGAISSRLRGYNQISASEAVQLLNHDNAILVDVREDNEFKEGHIIDAKHIPLGKLNERMDELEPFRDQPIVVNCRSGHRSASACGQLRKKGFTTVYNLKGGIMAWQSAGLPVQKPSKGKKRK